MKDLSALTHRELAAFICEHLRGRGIEMVLTGGACVTIYTRNRYESLDLDFVNVAGAPGKRIDSALAEIGFLPEGRIYVSKKSRYSVDILSPPLSIGEEKISETYAIHVRKMELRLLTPTDSVRDRLAAFYFWNDLQTLEQALMVARNNPVDLDVIERWSKREGESAKFRIFRERLK
ncbi:MAG: hypothetical protein MUF02_06465 [Acidobacteria bacterium]|nr:hypothetical protein [Acidobacteriota bacterium]